jgi:hypothetical protein
MRNPLLLVAAGALVATASAGAQSALPPIRPIGTVIKVSPTDLLGSVSTVRPLPAGRVLVNDLVRRQLVLLDSTLKQEAIVADTTAATANAFGGRSAGLLAYRADSSLFIDPASLSMLVIDAEGKVARVMAVPRPADAPFMVGGPFGTPGIDTKGRIVYRGFVRPQMPSGPPEPGRPFAFPQLPDSAPVLRVGLADRKLDTASWFKTQTTKMSGGQNDKGEMVMSMVINPLPVVDDWALLSDGSVAVVRGKDYHVDWISADGAVRTTPKIPYDWERMTDDDRTRVLDSARARIAEARTNGQINLGGGGGNAAGGAAAGGGGGPAAGGGPGGGGGGQVFVMIGGPGGGGGGPPGGADGGRPGQFRMQPPTINVVQPSELPDYRPAFNTGAARGDADGNLWVRTTKLVNNGPVYDVINQEGKLIDRVQLPQGRVIAGFGNGLVYMGVRDDKGARLEVARLK